MKRALKYVLLPCPLIVALLLLTMFGSRAQQGKQVIPPSAGASGTPASLGTLGPYLNIQSPTYNPNGTVGKGGCLTDGAIAATNVVTSTAQLTAGTYAGSPPKIGEIAWLIKTNGNTGPCHTSNANVGLTTTLRIPLTATTVTTISNVNIAAGTVTLSGSTAFTEGSDVLIWGGAPDATSDWLAMSTACTSITNNGIGGVVYAPKGIYVFGTNTSSNPACNIASTVTGSADIRGDGEDQTIFFTAPWYSHTFNFGSVFAQSEAGYAYAEGWTLDGQGVCIAVGPDTPYDPTNPAIDHITVRHFCLTSGSTEIIYAGSGGLVGQHNYINNSTFVADGTQMAGLTLSGPYQISLVNDFALSGNNNSGPFQMTASAGGADVSIVGGAYILGGNASGPAMTLPSSGTPGASTISISGGTSICGGPGTAFGIKLNRTGWILNVDSAFINNGVICGAVSGNPTGIATIAGSVLHVAKTQISANGTGVAISNAGTTYDDCGNTFVGGWSGTGASLLCGTSTGLQPTITGTGACASPVATGTVPLNGSNTCPGTSGAATLTLTWAPNAPNGYICPLPRDVTTGADVFTFTSSNATTCVYGAAAIVQNDVITWGAVGEY